MFKNLCRVLVKSEVCYISVKPAFENNKTNMSTTCKCAQSDSPTILKNLFVEAVTSVQPASLIKNQVKLIDRHLVVAGQKFALNKPCYVVGFGKAVLGMAVELEKTLGDDLKMGVVTVPTGIFEKYTDLKEKEGKIRFIEGAKDNIPDKDAVEGAVKIKELVEKLTKDDLLIVLISGGGSALLPLPKSPISLEEKQSIIKNLSRGGASINELNAVRTQLSVLKGGGLAKLAFPSTIVSLILSDVVGDPLDIIASGPTVVSNTGPEDAIEILKKYSLYETSPVSIKTVLENATKQSKSENSVTPSCPNERNPTDRVFNFIIGTNKIATEAAKKQAIKNGFRCVVMSHNVEEDVDKLAEIYAKLVVYMVNGKYVEMRELLDNLPFELEPNALEQFYGLWSNRKMLLIFAGEPTVFVKGTGKGGRNQQLALAFSVQLDKLGVKLGNIYFLSGGTDGIDGPTDAAGAVGFSGLVERCSRLDINPVDYLNNNDSYNFFSKFENGEFLVKVGHTGTNVMDLHFILIDPLEK